MCFASSGRCCLVCLLVLLLHLLLHAAFFFFCHEVNAWPPGLSWLFGYANKIVRLWDSCSCRLSTECSSGRPPKVKLLNIESHIYTLLGACSDTVQRYQVHLTRLQHFAFWTFFKLKLPTHSLFNTGLLCKCYSCSTRGSDGNKSTGMWHLISIVCKRPTTWRFKSSWQQKQSNLATGATNLMPHYCLCSLFISKEVPRRIWGSGGSHTHNVQEPIWNQMSPNFSETSPSRAPGKPGAPRLRGQLKRPEIQKQPGKSLQPIKTPVLRFSCRVWLQSLHTRRGKASRWETVGGGGGGWWWWCGIKNQQLQLLLHSGEIRSESTLILLFQRGCTAGSIKPQLSCHVFSRAIH